MKTKRKRTKPKGHASVSSNGNRIFACGHVKRPDEVVNAKVRASGRGFSYVLGRGFVRGAK